MAAIRALPRRPESDRKRERLLFPYNRFKSRLLNNVGRLIVIP